MTKKRARPSAQPKVKLADAKYQPNKAELEQDLRPETPGEVTLEEFTEMTRQLVQPVDIEWTEKPERFGLRYSAM